MTAQVLKTSIRQEHLWERLSVKAWFWLVFVGVLFAYPVYRSLNRVLPPELPIMYHVPQFALVNENGQSFGSEDLKGKVYLANFIFASCPTTCPEMLKGFQKIQKRLRGLREKVAIVSFTVDPENDKPPVLFKLARQYKANPRVWSFLTGDFEQIEKLLVEGFKVPVGSPVKLEGANTSVYDIAHSQRVVLVDRLGRIRGYYGLEKQDVDKMMIDIGLMINREPSKEPKDV